MLILDDLEAIWVIPENVTADELEASLRLLKQYIDEPPSFEDGKTGGDLIRRKVIRKESYSDSDDPSSSDSSGSGSTSKPRKPSKKRKRRQVDDAEAEARREKRRLADLEKRAMIKSAVRIVDSEDDEDADLEFFEREKELREKMARRALEGDLPSTGTRKVGEKKKRPKKKTDSLSEPKGSDVDVEMEGNVNDAEVFGMASLEPSSQVSISLDDNTDGSDNGEIEKVNTTKKRKIRRALSMSSDED
jgi:replication fork protection complex subunit Tof1/Swi1